MEFLMSIDALLSLIVGAIIGGLAGQVMKGLGLAGNIAVGLIGGIIGGWLFDMLNLIDVGDYADPIIAGAVGSIILLAVVGVIPRPVPA